MQKENNEGEIVQPGFAIVGRFIDGGSNRVVERVDLAIGEVAIFQKGGGYDKFSQRELEDGLARAAKAGVVEALAVCDSKTGVAVLVWGKSFHIGTGPDTPGNNRIFWVSIDGNRYYLIWGENKLIANANLYYNINWLVRKN